MNASSGLSCLNPKAYNAQNPMNIKMTVHVNIKTAAINANNISIAPTITARIPNSGNINIPIIIRMTK